MRSDLWSDTQFVASFQSVLTCAPFCPHVEVISGKPMAANPNYPLWITHTCLWPKQNLDLNYEIKEVILAPF